MHFCELRKGYRYPDVYVVSGGCLMCDLDQAA
jgi:hypothetical protein